jgi:DNA-binding CsgD family transcriptional regulator
MVSIEEFSALINILYAAALHPEQWEEFLTLLTRATGSRFTVFLTADTHLGIMCRAQGGDHPAHALDILAYNQQYVHNDPFRAPCLTDPRPRIVHSEDVLPNGALVDSDLYRDLLAPNNCRYATLALLNVSVRRLEIITIWRSLAQGPMPPDSVRLLELLFPHIRRALDMRQLLGVSQQSAATAATIADASATAAFLLKSSGELVHANAAGSALIAQQNTFTTHEGRLTLAHESDRPAFRTLLRKASSPPDAHHPAVAHQHALALKQSDGKAALQVVANPIPPDLAASTGAHLLLLVSDPDAERRFPDAILRDLYRLTAAESEVANGLLMGYSLQEIAALRKVSLGTVRIQLKSILAKTGVTRQSDLVRLLMSVPYGSALN